MVMIPVSNKLIISCIQSHMLSSEVTAVGIDRFMHYTICSF